MVQFLGSAIYTILIILLCFEEIFNNTIFPLTTIKYGVTLLLLCRVFVTKKVRIIRVPLLVASYYIILIIYLILSIPDFILINFDGLHVWKRYLWLPIIIILFLNSKEITGKTNCYFIKVFIHCVVIYSILNFVLYFIPLPIWSDSDFFFGRISVGYPTIDVVIIAYALLLIFFHADIHLNNIRRFFYLIILSLSIISQASGTGIVLLFFIYVMNIYNIFKYLRTPNKAENKAFEKDTIKVFLLYSLFLLLMASSLYTYITVSEPELAEAMELQIENRTNILWGEEEESELNRNTMEDRIDWFKAADKTLVKDDWGRIVFGCGYGVITSKSHGGYHQFRLEDQYYSNRLALGWFGTILYFVAIISLLILCIRKYRGNHVFYTYFSASMITLLASFTSVCLGSVGISLALALIIVDSSHFQRCKH